MAIYSSRAVHKTIGTHLILDDVSSIQPLCYWITYYYSVNIGRQAGWYITDIVYLLDVLVVIVYMSFCNCWDYLLLHEDWGECSEDWAGACRWGGGGGGKVEFLTEKKKIR